MDKDELEALLLEIRGNQMAQEQLITALLIQLTSLSPQAMSNVMVAFDNAANSVESLSIQHGESARHFTKALEAIEQIRVIVEGRQKPRHGV